MCEPIKVENNCNNCKKRDGCKDDPILCESYEIDPTMEDNIDISMFLEGLYGARMSAICNGRATIWVDELPSVIESEAYQVVLRALVGKAIPIDFRIYTVPEDIDKIGL